MSIKDKLLSIFTDNDDDDEEEEYLAVDESEAKTISSYEKPKTKGLSNAELSIMMFEPRTLDEVHEIGKHLKRKQAAVVNLKKLEDSMKQRAIDFLQGVTFGLSGATKIISSDSVLCTPRNIGVGGEISKDNMD